MMNLKEKYPDWKDPCEHDWEMPKDRKWIRVLALVTILIGFTIQLLK